MKKSFGVWSTIDKRFMFGIKEPTKGLAKRAFLERAGFYPSWCHEIREVPDGWANPPNPRRGRFW